MNFQDFTNFVNSLSCPPVILLEGKRDVKDNDKHLLIELGKTLAANFQGATFRTGNAKGADELFAKGVSEMDPERIEFILPYKDHRKKYIYPLSYSASVDDINLAKEPELIYSTKSAGQKNANIVGQYENGIRNKLTIKASYLIRDTVKVLGSPSLNLKKADIAIFYDDLCNPAQGGTGHTMRVCAQNGVPVITQKEWFNWL